MTRLVDFHCHLDQYPDFERLVREIDRLGIYTLAVTTTPMNWRRSHDVCGSTKHVRAAIGLHPELVGTHLDQVPVLEKLLGETRYIGEIGIDGGPRSYGSLAAQTEVFLRIVAACAEHGGKVMSIHSFRAVKKVLDALERYFPPGSGVAVLHWFTGSQSEAKRAVSLGCYFSVNERMAVSANGAKLLAVIPVDRLLTETDGPLTKTRGRPSSPLDVCRAVEAMASSLGREKADVATIVLGNLRTVIGMAERGQGSAASTVFAADDARSHE
jgi:TatD DNase family protein